MQVVIVLTVKEIEFCKALAQYNYTYNFSMRFDSFRKEWEEEIRTFRNNGLLYHSNSESEGYIEYSLTELGKKTIESYFEITIKP